MLRKQGEYKGKVLCIHGNDLMRDGIFPRPNVEFKYFPDLNTQFIIEQHQQCPFVFKTCDGRENRKPFQWHKLYIFHRWVREYCVTHGIRNVLYIDSGSHIFAPIAPFWDLDCAGKLLAVNDSLSHGPLTVQFDQKSRPDVYEELNTRFKLEQDYFLNSLFLFDSALIKDDTFDKLCELMNRYPIARCNEMSIMNLYFVCMCNVWQPLPTTHTRELYQFSPRPNKTQNDYIILKYLT